MRANLNLHTYVFEAAIDICFYIVDILFFEFHMCRLHMIVDVAGYNFFYLVCNCIY